MSTQPAAATTPLDGGDVVSTITDGVGTIRFSHPKGNSLPGALLRRLAESVAEMGGDAAARVIVLRSEGSGPFCAGASFDELAGIASAENGAEFFGGFAKVILAMIHAPQFVLARVHGRVAGGGVGLAAAADYTLAARGASARLSELAVGIGPFVVGPVIERRIGRGGFAAMAIDTEWRDAEWCERRGLYARLFDDVASMDGALETLAIALAAANPEAVRAMKLAFWEGTSDWESLLAQRARTSGALVLSEHTRAAIGRFRAR